MHHVGVPRVHAAAGQRELTGLGPQGVAALLERQMGIVQVVARHQQQHGTAAGGASAVDPLLGVTGAVQQHLSPAPSTVREVGEEPGVGGACSSARPNPSALSPRSVLRHRFVAAHQATSALGQMSASTHVPH